MDLSILTVGDVVGAPGRRILEKRLPALIEELGIDLVVANAENVTQGSGISARDAKALFEAGVDVITTGDHVWRKKDLLPILEKDARIVRAANFKKEVRRGFTVVPTEKGVDVGVTHLIGRVFMPPIDCPFEAADRVVAQMTGATRVIVVDMHCEATSEKVAMGRYLDGRVSAVFGSHTHVPTADACVRPKGTGYITDVGMTGPYDSVIGRRVEPVLKRFVTGLPSYFDVADGDVRIGAARFVVDAATGRCRRAERIEVADRPEAAR